MKTFSLLLLIASLASSTAAQPAAPRPAHPAPQNVASAPPPDQPGPQPWMDGRHGWDEDREHGEECDFKPMRDDHGHHGFRWLIPILVIMVIVHLLLTILVAKDVQLTGASPLWIFIALLAGLPGTAVYSLFRIGTAVAKDKSASA